FWKTGLASFSSRRLISSSWDGPCRWAASGTESGSAASRMMVVRLRIQGRIGNVGEAPEDRRTGRVTQPPRFASWPEGAPDRDRAARKVRDRKRATGRYAAGHGGVQGSRTAARAR